MTKAPVGSKSYVKGNRSATVSAGPIPGSTPTKVPSVTPIAASRRYSGRRAVAKPPARSPRTSISEQRVQKTVWQPDTQELGKREEYEHAQYYPDGKVAQDLAAPSAPEHVGRSREE